MKEDELEVSHEDIIKALLVAVSDQSEACRDISISVLQGLVFWNMLDKRLLSNSPLSLYVQVLIANQY